MRLGSGELFAESPCHFFVAGVGFVGKRDRLVGILVVVLVRQITKDFTVFIGFTAHDSILVFQAWRMLLLTETSISWLRVAMLGSPGFEERISSLCLVSV